MGAVAFRLGFSEWMGPRHGSLLCRLLAQSLYQFRRRNAHLRRDRRGSALVPAGRKAGPADELPGARFLYRAITAERLRYDSLAGGMEREIFGSAVRADHGDCGR